MTPRFDAWGLLALALAACSRPRSHPVATPSADASARRDVVAQDSNAAALERMQRCIDLAARGRAAWERAVSGACRSDEDCTCVDPEQPCARQRAVARSVFLGEISGLRALRAQRRALVCPDVLIEDAYGAAANCAPTAPCEAACVEGRCQQRARCDTLRAEYRALVVQRSCVTARDCVTVGDGAVSRSIAARVTALATALRAEHCVGDFAPRPEVPAQCVARRCRSVGARDLLQEL